MMTQENQLCIPVELRLALYRRAVACAYRDACRRYGLRLDLTLDALETAIAEEVEALYVQEHGVEQGVEMACDALGDMVYPDFLDLPPCLTLLGESVWMPSARTILTRVGSTLLYTRDSESTPSRIRAGKPTT